MGATHTVPVFDTQGTLRDIPAESLQDAVKAGGVPAHPVKAPDGSVRLIPVTRLAEAQKAGGTIMPLEAPEKSIPAMYGFTAGNMLKNAWEGAKSVVAGAAEIGQDLATNPNWIIGENSTAKKFVTNPAGAEAQKATDAFKKGHYAEAAGHELAGAIPLIGPAAAQIGEQAGTGDVGGALAKGTAQAATAPILLKGAGAAGDLVKAKAAAIAPDLYKSALKPSTAIPAAKTARIIDAGIKEGIPVSEAGTVKLKALIQELDNAKTAEIAKDPTRPISTAQVASRVSEPIRRFSNQVNPYDDLNAISNARDEFIASQPAYIDAAKAQSLKQGTYAQLGSKAYGEMKTATVEAQKALARGLKEELNTAFPELAKINAQESRLYDLQPVLERAVNRIGNHQLMGIGTPLVGTATKAVTGSSGIGGVAAAMKFVLDNPAVKSHLAIALSKGGKIPPGAAQVRIGNYLDSLGAAGASSASDELAAGRASE